MALVIRNLILALGGLALLIFAMTAGLFIFGILAVVGIIFMLWFKLRGKDFVNPVDQMGWGRRETTTQTIEVEYEVVEENDKKLEKDRD